MAKRSEKKKNTGLVGIAAGTTTLGLAMQCLPPPTRADILDRVAYEEIPYKPLVRLQ